MINFNLLICRWKSGRMTGYKITDPLRTRLIGVASKSLEQLLKKGSQKLNLSAKSCFVTLEDGTVVDDEEYFQTLPSQTVFVFQSKSFENVPITGAEIILNALRTVNVTFLNVGQEIENLLNEKADEILSILSLAERENKANLSSKSDDPRWFENLESNAMTKEDFMRRKAQDRIRGYFYKFQDDVRRHPVYMENQLTRKRLSECLRLFKRKLTEDEFFGCFFDRRCAATVDATDCHQPKKIKIAEDFPGVYYDLKSFCDGSGSFVCQGLWKDNYCSSPIKHAINPYSNRESRILFSTWNLDHRIEKNRTVLPAIIEASLNERPLNFQYFYALLFTNYNLKIVHVICHDKRYHEIVCDSKLMHL